MIRVVLIGVVYAAIGLITGSIAGNAETIAGRTAWRFSAFVISGVVFVTHLVVEHQADRAAVRRTAARVALAAAIGGFLLAVAAVGHNLRFPSGSQRFWIALPTWPLLVGIPAFIAGWAGALVLTRLWRSR